MICQLWFRLWLGAVRQQAITWANVDPDFCRHMASLGHNELNDIIWLIQVTQKSLKPREIWKRTCQTLQLTLCHIVDGWTGSDQDMKLQNEFVNKSGKLHPHLPGVSEIIITYGIKCCQFVSLQFPLWWSSNSHRDDFDVGAWMSNYIP